MTNESATAFAEELTRWGVAEPVLPEILAEHRASFLNGAPAGTLIKIGDEVYRRTLRDNWICLDELVYEGSAYYSERGYEIYSSEQLIDYPYYPGASLQLVELGKA